MQERRNEHFSFENVLKILGHRPVLAEVLNSVWEKHSARRRSIAMRALARPELEVID